MNQTRLFDGENLADKILMDVKKEIKEKNINAMLAVILIGDNPASKIYIKMKEKKCCETGINFELIKFKSNVSHNVVRHKITELNKNQKVTGILVQLPLPRGWDMYEIVNLILPEKDVDGLTGVNRERLKEGNEILTCCTPKGIIYLLKENKTVLEDKKIVLVGHGYLVGQPLSLMFQNRKLNFSVCDIYTKNLKEETKKADILISATGSPHLIKEDYVKEGAIVIDVGVSKLNGKIVGDVDFENVKKKTSWITPVLGGVGPVTVAMLMHNILAAYNLQHQS